MNNELEIVKKGLRLVKQIMNTPLHPNLENSIAHLNRNLEGAMKYAFSTFDYEAEYFSDYVEIVKFYTDRLEAEWHDLIGLIA